jgi:hypothetical protein
MAFAYICPSKQLSFTGICHISGRFTGTSVKLRHQYGMEISLPTPGDAGEMETYRMTFPRGSIKGFVTLSPYVQLEEVSMIVCRKTGLRVVIHYKDEVICFLEFPFVRFADIFASHRNGTRSREVSSFPASSPVSHQQTKKSLL